jgi:hypothetical protein
MDFLSPELGAIPTLANVPFSYSDLKIWSIEHLIPDFATMFFLDQAHVPFLSGISAI